MVVKQYRCARVTRAWKDISIISSEGHYTWTNIKIRIISLHVMIFESGSFLVCQILGQKAVISDLCRSTQKLGRCVQLLVHEPPWWFCDQIRSNYHICIYRIVPIKGASPNKGAPNGLRQCCHPLTRPINHY